MQGPTRFEGFRADQQTAEWIAWREDVDPTVDALLSGLLAVAQPDPWSREGLIHAEDAARWWIPVPTLLELPEGRDRADRIAMFLGEVLRRNFGGEWINAPRGALDWGDGLGPSIRYPYTDLMTDPRRRLVAVVDNAYHRYWAMLWDHHLDCLRRWRELGCPTRGQWEQAGWVPPEKLEANPAPRQQPKP
ncbi:hypothetical protein AB0H76_09685 [Nocardia sp. NPDC050712]|uniref:hypothetical protein n=1 Tax=Nocardia sp. NPDC050712 TaxID=3155518 RepID=UPI0033E705F9